MSDTIKGKSVEVEISDGGKVEVRRMKWKPAREFLKRFGTIAATLMRRKEGGDILADLPSFINQSEELVSHIAKHCTDKTPEQFDELDAVDALKVLAEAFALNYDEELKNFFAGIVPKIAAHIPADKGTTTS